MNGFGKHINLDKGPGAEVVYLQLPMQFKQHLRCARPRNFVCASSS